MGTSGAISRLYIANANKKDSGNYSCALADVAAATTVSVHVLNGIVLHPLQSFLFNPRRLLILVRPVFSELCIRFKVVSSITKSSSNVVSADSRLHGLETKTGCSLKKGSSLAFLHGFLDIGV